jgi:hypothetical protein
MRPQRSLRLEKRSAKSLDTLSGARGEIFYDVDNDTLRIYVDNSGTKSILATQAWADQEIQANKFSGQYSDLIGAPTFLSSFTNNVGFITIDDIPEPEQVISTLSGLADTVITTPEVGQLLQYDGTDWINTTVEGFEDTNTTYNLDIVTTTDGVDLNLTDSDAVSDTVKFLGGDDISVSISNTNEVTISNTAQYALTDLTGLTISNPQDGHVLEYNSGIWINVPATSGVALTDFTVTSQPASGNGSLTYDDSTGAFTFTPPDIGNVGIALTDLSTTTSTSTGGGSLSYNNSSGVFTFRPANVSVLTPSSIQFPSGAVINEFSIDDTLGGSSNTVVPTENAVKTYVDTAISNIGGGGGATAINDLSDVDTSSTPPTNGQALIWDNASSFWVPGSAGAGSYDQTLNTTDDVEFNSVSSPTFTNTGVGAPSITSASTITLDAPDGTIVQSGPFRLPSFTTNDKNNLVAVNGDMVYDITLNKAQVYENGAWVNLV